MGRNVLIFGPPGSGKGTQAAAVATAHGLAHVSTGDMLREAMAAGTELGQRVKEIVDRGDLVSDDLMLDLVRDRLQKADAQTGVLLDGYPRTLAQAEALVGMLSDDGAGLDRVLALDVADEELIRRALARGRVDDTEETIRHRISVYREQTEPVLSFLEGKTNIVTIDGVGRIEEITERVNRGLDAEH